MLNLNIHNMAARWRWSMPVIQQWQLVEFITSLGVIQFETNPWLTIACGETCLCSCGAYDTLAMEREGVKCMQRATLCCHEMHAEQFYTSGKCAAWLIIQKLVQGWSSVHIKCDIPEEKARQRARSLLWVKLCHLQMASDSRLCARVARFANLFHITC